jgi:hypothetical protein
LLALDGQSGDLKLATQLPKLAQASHATVDEVFTAGAVAPALQTIGCDVTLWQEPDVSINVLNGKRTVTENRVEKPYRPTHVLTPAVRAQFAIVLRVESSIRERRKRDNNEPLRIDYSYTGQVYRTGRPALQAKAHWLYAEPAGADWPTFGVMNKRAEEQAFPLRAASERVSTQLRFLSDVMAKVDAALLGTDQGQNRGRKHGRTGCGPLR